MDDNDDPFERMVDDGEDHSAVDELELELNQLRETRPDFAPENLHADGLVDFDRDAATNKSRPLPVDEIVNKHLAQPVETIEDGSSDEDEVPDEPISPPSQNEIDEALEIQSVQSNLDLDLDPLLLKVSKKMKQSFISDLLKKQ